MSVTKVAMATRVPAAGEPPKMIEEYIGRVNTQDERVSVAVMSSPVGWKEPGQRPEFTEYTLVLEGILTVEHEHGTFEVAPGQAVVAEAGSFVRYSTPSSAAKYVAICLPAFSPSTVQREASER